MSETNVCAEKKHLYMEPNLSSVYEPTSLCTLLFHSVSESSEVLLDPLIHAISVHNMWVPKSIIGEVENLGLPGMYPHEVVCHDGDEALVVLAHAIQDVLLRYLNELVFFIEYEVDRFYFFLALPVWKENPYSLVIIVLETKVLLCSFLIHPFLVHVPIYGMITSECIPKG